MSGSCESVSYKPKNIPIVSYEPTSLRVANYNCEIIISLHVISCFSLPIVSSLQVRQSKNNNVSITNHDIQYS